MALEGFILRYSSSNRSSQSIFYGLCLWGEPSISLEFSKPPKVYNNMQNNQEAPGSSHSPEEQKQQPIRKEMSSFEEQLDESKRVLDQIHDEYHSKYENMHREMQVQREKVRSIQQKNEGNSQQGFQKIDTRKGDGYFQNEGEKEESIDVSRSMMKKPSKIFQGCNCLKSKCSKNYCECFTQGRRCNELCKCMGCENHSENQFRLRANLEVEVGERACYCKKSNCLKKYCECYNNGVKCNANCKCEECKNTEDNLDNEKSNHLRMDVEEAKAEPRKQRSQQQIQQINNKIDEIVKATPAEYHQLMFTFLEYWLS